MFNLRFPEILELLLDYGAEINHQNLKKETVLHEAVRFDRNDCVDLLLKRGVDLNLRDIHGRSALHVAVVWKNVEALKLILKNRYVDLNSHIDRQGNTPLHFIKSKERLVEHFNYKCNDTLDVLLCHGGNMDARNYRNCSPTSSFCELRASLLERPRKTYFDKVSLLGYEPHNDNLARHLEKICQGGPSRHYALLECERELERMKNILISVRPKTSLYDLLFVRKNRMAVSSNNENLLKLLDDCEGDFENEFPNYGLILNHKLNRGTVR